MTQVTPVRPNLQLSMHSLNSQEQWEAALRELMLEPNLKNGLCSVDSISDSGKRRQLLKMLGLILTPLLVMFAVTFYFLAESVTERADVIKISDHVRVSVKVARTVHALQRERDFSALYLSAISPGTRYELLLRYLETDDEMRQLSSWPTELDLNNRPQFESSEAFQEYLKNHRNGLTLSSTSMYEEMNFYSSGIEVFIRWLYDSITVSRFGTVWKILVAYQKIVSGKEEVGIERALGSSFFYQGGFTNSDKYLEYIQKSNTFNYSFRSAQIYSPTVRPIADLKIRNADLDLNLAHNLDYYRNIIQMKNISFVSEEQATLYYDNMTMYIDILLEIQRSLANEILETLDEGVEMVTGDIILGAMLIFVVLILCPVQIHAVYKHTTDIQRYALTLADKTRELNQEKKRTDSLLYQMLPRPVADRLKNKQEVNAQYYKEATIFFSAIFGFAKLSGECTPMQIVELLKELYSYLDKVIEKYDVYKVETIGEQYMVASGLPEKNGKRHAPEIALMALELVASSIQLRPVNLPGSRVSLRIGIHSGPVMAGVVGTKLPRYCLFGDTVNTASRMESNSMANKIHISGSTYKILNKTGQFILNSRGPIDIKGKGQMVTYWLLGFNENPESQSQSRGNTKTTVALKDSSLITGRDIFSGSDNDNGVSNRCTVQERPPGGCSRMISGLIEQRDSMDSTLLETCNELPKNDGISKKSKGKSALTKTKMSAFTMISDDCALHDLEEDTETNEGLQQFVSPKEQSSAFAFGRRPSESLPDPEQARTRGEANCSEVPYSYSEADYWQ